MVQFNEYAFRRFQVVGDLKLVARRARGSGFAQIATAVPGVGHSAPTMTEALYEVLAGDGRIPEKIAPDLHPCLQFAASQPRDSAPAFEAATAFLLTDRLMMGSGTDTLFWYWDIFAEHYRAAGPQVRAALAQGFDLCHRAGLVELDEAPAASDLTTRPKADICRDLLALARRMTKEEMRAIAALEGEERAARHGAEMATLLGRGGGIFSPDQDWFPAHVVECTANRPDAPGFVACQALMCLNALTDDQALDDMSFRWMNTGAALLDMPQVRTAPVLAGLRHLFESRHDWNWHGDWSADQLKLAAPLLPWIDPLA